MNWLRRFPYWHEAVLALLLTGLMIWAGRADEYFVETETQLALSANIWERALLAIPMTLIIITAGIDLSVGSIIALSAVVLGLSYEQGMSPWLGAVLAILAGAAAGGCNGVFIAKVRVHPLIVTLATLAAFRGLAEGISKARPFSGFPESFAYISNGQLWGIPIPGIVFAVGAILAAIVLIKTPLGRYLYAMGHNETATRFSGVSVDRIKLLLYTLSGATAGLAAVMLVSRHNTAKADLGAGLELDVITAVVLGGTSIFGGRGNIGGTILGILLVHETREWISWRWNQAELNLIVIGMLLIGSVLLNRLLSVRRRSS